MCLMNGVIPSYERQEMHVEINVVEETKVAFHVAYLWNLSLYICSYCHDSFLNPLLSCVACL